VNKERNRYSRREFLVAAGLATGFTITLLATRGAFSGSGGKEGNRSEETAPFIPEHSSSTTEQQENVIRRNIKPTKLWIPSIGIENLNVIGQRLDNGNVSAPHDGSIATNENTHPNLDNVLWLFAHSRVKGERKPFYALQYINIDDEIVIDAEDRNTKEAYINLTFKVDKMYLADRESAERLLNHVPPHETPRQPILLLQTSVRQEWDTNWILDPQNLQPKAENLVGGDINDLSKYLFLFVTSRLVS
jgi:hypothetical protein